MKKPLKPKTGQSLGDVNPDLAKQWHPTKNGELTPFDVRAGSTAKAWWKCSEGEDHEWGAVIADRHRGIGCAVCSNYKVVESNSLAVLDPDLAREWHPSKNGKLTPFDVHPGSAKKVWWKCPQGDDHEWKTVVHSRTWGRRCPVCSGRKVVKSTCLATTNPELAKQWHPTKNGRATPYNTGPNSGKMIWWKCPKGTDHEWKASVNNRNRGLGCSICSNQKIVDSNCLATLHPDLAAEWHPSKNGCLTPYDIGAGSGKKIWWKCPEGDDHEWKSTAVARTGRSKACPICIGRKVVNSNSFLTLYPELAKQLHPTKNGKKELSKFRPFSNARVWWKCPRGDDHEWKTSFNMRVQGTGCPKCNSAKSAPELRIYCELKTIFANTQNRIKVLGREVDIFIPELNLGIEYDGWYWHKDKVKQDLAKNKQLASELTLIRVREEGLEKLSETDILLTRKEMYRDGMKAIFRAILVNIPVEMEKYKSYVNAYLEGNDWAAIETFNKIQFETNGLIYERSLSYVYPEIASQWHYEKNEPLSPEQFTPNSREKVWWTDDSGKEWQADIISRTRLVRARKDADKHQYNLF
jgi:cytochrome c-type biogenesis protein CcmH/NrfF